MEIVNFVTAKNSQLPRVDKSWFTGKIFAALLCILYLAVSFMEISSNFDKKVGNSNSTVISLWWEDMVSAGKARFFVSSKTEVVLGMEVFFGATGVIGELHA